MTTKAVHTCVTLADMSVERTYVSARESIAIAAVSDNPTVEASGSLLTARASPPRPARNRPLERTLLD